MVAKQSVTINENTDIRTKVNGFFLQKKKLSGKLCIYCDMQYTIKAILFDFMFSEKYVYVNGKYSYEHSISAYISINLNVTI